jgi:hypothetical protein
MDEMKSEFLEKAEPTVDDLVKFPPLDFHSFEEFLDGSFTIGGNRIDSKWLVNVGGAYSCFWEGWLPQDWRKHVAIRPYSGPPVMNVQKKPIPMLGEIQTMLYFGGHPFPSTIAITGTSISHPILGKPFQDAYEFTPNRNEGCYDFIPYGGIERVLIPVTSKPKSNFGEGDGAPEALTLMGGEGVRVEGEGVGAPEALTLMGGEGVRVEGEGVGAPEALTSFSHSKFEFSEKFSETGPGIPSSSILNGGGLFPGDVALVAPKKKIPPDKIPKLPIYQAAMEQIRMKATKVQHPPLDFHSGTDPPEFISKNYPITGVVFPSQSGRYGSSRGSCRE